MRGSGQLDRVDESKVQFASRRIHALALQGGPGTKLPTVRELRQSLGVGMPTLMDALWELESRGVLSRRHGSGLYVSSTVHQRHIGVVFGGDIFGKDFSPFWGLLLRATQDAAGDHQFLPRAYLDIAQTPNGLGGHEQLVEDLEAHRLDGLLLLAPRVHDDERAALRAYGAPLVVLGGRPPADWSVTFDRDEFLQLAARELAATDCRRIGFLGSPAQSVMLAGALRAAGRGEVQIDDWSYETWAKVIPGAGTRENCARRLTERMLAARATTPLPDTLVSLEDTMTRGVITALSSAGVQPGRDLRIVTAENQGSPVLEPWAAALTRIAFDPRALVQAALAMLATLMDGGRPPENPVRIGTAAEKLKTESRSEAEIPRWAGRKVEAKRRT